MVVLCFFVLGLERELGSLRLTPLSLPFVFNNLLSTWLDMFGGVWSGAYKVGWNIWTLCVAHTRKLVHV